jgi:hypothetical protein
MSASDDLPGIRQSTLGKKGANPQHVAIAMKNLGAIREAPQFKQQQQKILSLFMSVKIRGLQKGVVYLC